MAETNDWKKRGATLTVEKACEEFDVHPDLIVSAINAGKLAFRQGKTPKGRPWTKVLRSEVQMLVHSYPAGALHLARKKNQAALSKVRQNIATVKRLLADFQEQTIELEKWLAANPTPR